MVFSRGIVMVQRRKDRDHGLPRVSDLPAVSTGTWLSAPPTAYVYQWTGPAASYACPRCQALTYNPTDIANRYCGRCHRFETS